MGAIAMALAELPTFASLEKGIRFAVQSRFVQTDKSLGERPYSSGQLNKSLAEAFAEETGAVEAIKKPQIVISILCTMHKAYLGISTAEENLSAWPGGARHFAQTEEQISRAEFKLLEALEVFGISLPENGRALDLGAAPGGWTRLLLDAGLSVIAVDPANLDPRLARRKQLEHYRGYAENYLEGALQRRNRFDIIANDMRMDAREAARLLDTAAECLRPDGVMISVLKLPHAAPGDQSTDKPERGSAYHQASLWDRSGTSALSQSTGSHCCRSTTAHAAAGDRFTILEVVMSLEPTETNAKNTTAIQILAPEYRAFASSHAYLRSDAAVYSLWFLSTHLPDIRCAGR